MISISEQAYRTKGALTVQPPKTDNSMRKIALSAELMELLKQEHAKHPGNPYLFPSPVSGGMYHPDSVVKLHQKILKDAGLEHIRFHDLRHTFASCCGFRQKLRLSKQARFLPTAATRSPRSSRHRRRLVRSPLPPTPMPRTRYRNRQRQKWETC